MRKDDKQTEEELKNFFEGALEADGIDETTPKDEEDEEAGHIDGLKVTLMTHQISGLEFLQNHESTEENKKGKGKYGGILADDVLPLYTRLIIDGSR
jgi:SNF2 family DNA or RNA helicase